ncbi:MULTISPECIES: DUF6473 family protein [Halocynthiibacter]|uniref:DUF6473 family protein n=1 Tax=Halocynthiibacter halioticoli TaxID=2986804 RepID=A0AAE3J1F2_9RHOB|nr:MULTISPECIES: DUF6473 family protein [Halocynthiibacter]MCV6825909.1 DUF6473 family protein [Halocynthiibacter halioticoli]MCW4058910.1 DUF6473 family protein [Halocynthiibacter sp. SDUM655004]
MAYENLGEGALDYLPCRYGKSKLLFRGPRRKMENAYIAAIGSTETYGKFVEEPFPNLVEKALGIETVNFGCVNAGPDVFLNEPVVLEACAKSRVTVVQAMGAQNMSNRFYAVHPRRNDRFLKASALMKTIFRDVDFTEFHFTRHMLQALKSLSNDRFALVEEELKAAWRARMQFLFEKIKGKTILLWVDNPNPDTHTDLGPDPLFIDRSMIEAVRPFCTEVVEVQLSDAARTAGVKGMVYPEMEAPIAKEVMGLQAHTEVAQALAPVLKRMM